MIPLLCRGAPGAPEQQTKVRLTVSKDAYRYEPGGKVRLLVTVDNQTPDTLEDVSIRARLHTADRTRSDLDASLDGKPRKSYLTTQTLESGLALEPGSTNLQFELPLSGRRFADGVYPLTVEAQRSYTVLASAVTQLVIISPETFKTFPLLRLSTVFDLVEPPHIGPDGRFSDNRLAGECAPGGRSPGWFANLTGAVGRWQNLHLSFSLSPMILQEMKTYAEGCLVENQAGGERKVSKESRAARNVADVVSAFKKMAREPRLQFLLTPFASPDLEKLCSLGWKEDARHQIAQGHKRLEKYLGTTIGKEYLYPPGLKCNSRVLASLGSDAGSFLILDPLLLDRTREGKKISSGMTPGSPVSVKAGNRKNVLSLFADRRLQALLKRLEGKDDAHFVAQAIISELTNLFLERPASLRSCVLVWPDRWRPSGPVTEEVFKALSGAPWLQSVTVGECLATIPPLEDVTLDIPAVTQPTGNYFAQVGQARETYWGFSRMVLKDNPLLPPMLQNLYISQSDIWRRRNRESSGLRYADSIISTINGEFKKIQIPAENSITLTSSRANIPLSVINGTGYRIRATLHLSSNGLTFPKGARQKVLLEPKENIIEIPVRVKKKGQVRLSARLLADSTLLGELNITVKTGRINTFAIILVGVLLGAIMITWAAKIITRRRAGKHKKKHSREEPEQRGAEA